MAKQLNMDIVIFLAVSACVLGSALTGDKKDLLNKRDPWLWPFAQDSIWNTPIGSEAKYIPAGIKKANHVGCDLEYHLLTKSTDPIAEVYSPSNWKRRWPGNKLIGSCVVPENLIIPDANPPHTPNNSIAILMPDGRTIRQLSPACRPEKTNRIVGWIWPDEDIYGPGINGSHGGSGLSAIGGSIRKGELAGDGPIRHVLKVNIWAEKYLFYGEQSKGFRWPATRSDSYAAKGYGGKKKELVMGSLLAIRPDISIEQIGLKTKPAKKLFYALQNYGAYIADDTAWNSHDICLENSVPDEVKECYGFDMSGHQGPWYDDINKLFSLLHVVNNNSPKRVGGGGKPRVGLAPPFIDKATRESTMR